MKLRKERQLNTWPEVLTAAVIAANSHYVKPTMSPPELRRHFQREAAKSRRRLEQMRRKGVK